MKIIAILVSAAASVMAQTSMASSLASRSIPELYRDASIVITGTVSGVSARCESIEAPCPRIYEISLNAESVASLKPGGAAIKGYGKLCSNTPLEIDATYTLFFDAPNEFNTQGASCRLSVNFDGAFQRIGSMVFRVGPLDTRGLVEFEGRKYMTGAVLEEDFDRVMDSLVSGP